MEKPIKATSHFSPPDIMHPEEERGALHINS